MIGIIKYVLTIFPVISWQHSISNPLKTDCDKHKQEAIHLSEHILENFRLHNVTAIPCNEWVEKLKAAEAEIFPVCQKRKQKHLYRNIQETLDRGWICVDEVYGLEISCESIHILQCTNDAGNKWLVGDDCPNWGGLGFTGIFLMFAALGLLGVGFYIIFSGMKKRLPSMPPQIPIYEEVEEKN